MAATPSHAGQTFETCMFAKGSIKTSPKNPQGAKCSPSPLEKKEFTSEGKETYEAEFERLEPVFTMYFYLVSFIPLYFISGIIRHAFGQCNRRAIYNTARKIK